MSISRPPAPTRSPAAGPGWRGRGSHDLPGDRLERRASRRATGGGISDIFPLPSYQANAHVPKSLNPGHFVGRGVPDVAGDADPESGYEIRVDGRTRSSAAPARSRPLGRPDRANEQATGQGGGFPQPVALQRGGRPMAGSTRSPRGITGRSRPVRAGMLAPDWGSPDGVEILAVVGRGAPAKKRHPGGRGRRQPRTIATDRRWAAEIAIRPLAPTPFLSRTGIRHRRQARPEALHDVSQRSCPGTVGVRPKLWGSGRSSDPAAWSEGVSQSRRPFRKSGKEWKRGEALRTLISYSRGKKNWVRSRRSWQSLMSVLPPGPERSADRERVAPDPDQLVLSGLW